MSDTFSGLATLQPLIDQCVHCGFCLPTCPSYLLLNQEMDSPRGRIYLMKAGVEGRIPLSDTFVRHFDSCLGCMACETACPSGVKYAPLIEEARAVIDRHYQRSTPTRLFRTLLFSLLPHPSRMRLVARSLGLVRLIRRVPWFMAWLPTALRSAVDLAPDAAQAVHLPNLTPAVGERRLRIGLLTGCVQQVFFGGVNAATARVLAAEGCDVVAPREQSCCGALALHAGRDEDAKAFARVVIAAFERAAVDQVVVNAAGCGSTMKSYGHLLRDDPAWADRARAFSATVRDASEALAALGEPRGARHPIELTVAYHDACHLAHAQGIRSEPRSVLGTIPKLRVVPLGEQDICCGSAGIFNLVQPDMARELGRRKAARIAESGADAAVTSNPGCLLQIQAAGREQETAAPVMHIMELVDASLRGESASGRVLAAARAHAAAARSSATR